MRGSKWARLLILLSVAALTLPVRAELTVYAWPREPLSYQDRDGKPKGLAVDILATLMEQAGEPYQLKFAPLNRAMQAVTKKPEVCVLLLERRQEREAHYSWVGPLLISRFSLYSAAENPLTVSDLENAKAFRVLSHMGSGVGNYLEEIGFNVDYSNHNGLNPDKLMRQRAPLWATSEVSAQVLSKQAEVAMPHEVLPFLTVMEAMACNVRSDRLRQQRLQSTLLALYRTGQIQQLYQRYGVTLD
ncbi:extracellular solute-binding protein, family 3 [Atopomonas hussainii]|uniref:Extracellular solute-binding protein, family 3 n=1 Tax=Atopomonas hussainii TaxID=1429083 RepID=A0A1H7I578_9GAMM|nr:transporter substrate-binding domain-containing protein [Atopomonas hussainii]SEK56620.1 extracellular solute-binding protein, family 3 [Atopomonas hussainii]